MRVAGGSAASDVVRADRVTRSQALDLGQFYFYVPIVGKYGAKPECGGCRFGTPSRWKFVISTRVRAKSPLELEAAVLVREHGEVQHLIDAVALRGFEGVQLLREIRQ